MQAPARITSYTKRLEIKQTNILLQCDLEPAFILAEQAIRYNRAVLETYITENPGFLSTLEPIEIPDNVPQIIKTMTRAGIIANVGPMASVAGAFAELSTEALCKAGASYGLAENGGDISILGNKRTTVIGIYDGKGTDNAASGKLSKFAFRVNEIELPIGICTSAGKIGHSISFGDANAAIVVSNSPSIADAVATAVGNRISKLDPEGSLQKALEFAEQLREINGCMVIIDDFVGRVGKLPELVELENSNYFDFY